MKKIYIIEDDKGISTSLKLYLENSDFKVYLYDSGDKATKKILEKKPNLVILDINLPIKSGLDIAKELREKSEIPILMLTAKTGESDRIKGFESGADDYIAKPFSPRELLVRIKSILRRFESKNSKNKNILKFKNIEIDTDKLTLKVSGKSIQITKNEFDILKKIVEEDGRLVSRETLMTEVIGYEKYIYDRTIDTHIKNLRKKIGDKNLILTIRGEGYRLNK